MGVSRRLGISGCDGNDSGASGSVLLWNVLERVLDGLIATDLPLG